LKRQNSSSIFAGFSLLEVMVAVAILGLSLTVIMSAEVGLFSAGTYGHNTSIAEGLLRCRMSEIEERMIKMGYPLLDESESGACCNQERLDKMSCSWKIEQVELPQPAKASFGDDPIGNPAGSGGLSLGGKPDFSSPSSLGPLGALANATGRSPGGGDPSLKGSGTSGLSGVLAAGASGGMGAIAPMVMSIVYPSFKPMFEASIRKVTVTVKWKEGIRSRELEVTQWLTNPQQGGFMSGAFPSDSSGLPGGAPGGAPPGRGGPTTTRAPTTGRGVR
jgi:general secretion pathway protein I